MREKYNKAFKITAIAGGAFLFLSGIAAAACLAHFVGFPKTVGETKYSHKQEEMRVEYAGISLYGKALVPQDGSRERFPTLIYAHGAESTHSADMTTLKSLAMSGIAVYTFDFYGWSAKSTGPDGKGGYMKGRARGVDDAYEREVIRQSKELSAVIAAVAQFDFVDTDAVFLMGSSMGGVTAALTAASHSDSLRSLILQYPAMNLSPASYTQGADENVANYTGDVLILQGTMDTITPLPMAQELAAHYNKARSGQAQLILYEGQPHVFTGKFKVEAAREIYRFITEKMEWRISHIRRRRCGSSSAGR